MNIEIKIKRLRKKLHYNIEKYGINSVQVRDISLCLDELINEYNQRQQIFNEDNNMKKAYEASIEKLKQIIKEFGEFPSIDEWNKRAKENVLLSSESIKYISHLNWNELREKLIYETNKKIF